MNHSETVNLLGKVDIYIIDQILKGRYQKGESILDAGCGSGRNLRWFYQSNFIITGVDTDRERIALAKANYPNISAKFSVNTIDNLPYNENSFNHILCCAVLHFAEDEAHFNKMIIELVRVLKPNGSLLIRVASDIGLVGKVPFVQDNFSKKLGAFFITRKSIIKISEEHPIILIEPIKTTNVNDERAMTTLVFQKT